MTLANSVTPYPHFFTLPIKFLAPREYTHTCCVQLPVDEHLWDPSAGRLLLSGLEDISECLWARRFLARFKGDLQALRIYKGSPPFGHWPAVYWVLVRSEGKLNMWSLLRSKAPRPAVV